MAEVEVAILTPDPAVGEYAQLWPRVLARLQATLRNEGIRATPTPWTAHVDDAAGLRDFAQVLPLLAWSYHLDHARWLRACATWRRTDLPMANPAEVLEWNSDKRYLAGLAARGVAIPHTAWTPDPSRARLEQFFDETGADELIVKPSVSGGAWKTQRVRRHSIDEAVAAAAGGGDMLVQPYLSTIASEGETSLLYFGGQLSHVVNKRPVPGDFRVQETFGGQYTLLREAPAAALELAAATLAAIDAPLLYARIDVVPDAEGRWLLMEAELIEPDFYLGVDPARGAGFARALRAQVPG
ncbi:hypothetical protein WCE41_02040 [Luteimonas sp. MJ246]|uniref:ATP-grasp domain-containing protein n=1 Tax=Luteimonas sp. MJ174 TaxID=3129237 RepID=UPI0031BBC5B9